ncbi:MAG: hypothetical protein ABI550_08230 [Ignavibacteriaceae bacterium]
MVKKFLSLIFIPLLFLLYNCGDKNENDQADISDQLKSKENLFDFIFVGMIGNQPGLYKYNSKKKNPEKLWSDINEKVVEFSYSDDMKSAFFVTAKDYGKKGVFPFINRVKLYVVNINSNKVNFAANIGDGMQLFTRWEDNENFKIVLNSIDRKVASFVNQHTFIFNTFGKNLIDEKKTYNIAKDGYPEPLSKNRDNNLTYENNTLLNEEENGKNLFYFDNDKIEKKLIKEDNKKLNQVAWAAKGEYLIFTTIDVTPGNETIYNKNPETSSLYIFSVKENKIIKHWDGGGTKTFFLNDGNLIFDDGFQNSSRIIIYNLNSMKLIDTIKITGGCGLENIPELPDYSA